MWWPKSGYKTEAKTILFRERHSTDSGCWLALIPVGVGQHTDNDDEESLWNTSLGPCDSTRRRGAGSVLRPAGSADLSAGQLGIPGRRTGPFAEPAACHPSNASLPIDIAGHSARDAGAVGHGVWV